MPCQPRSGPVVSPCRRLRVGLVGAALLGCLIVPRPARADLVRLTSGRVLSVEACQFTDDTVELTLRDGGHVIMGRALVVEVLPDEVPHPKPALLEAAAAPANLAAPVEGGSAAIRGLIDRLAARFGVDARLAHAVVRAESNYEPRAVSAKGAMGLMQLMPAVVQQYGIDDPFDPEENLEAGLKHLRGLLDRFDLSVALAAYNAGEAAVARYGGVPPYAETRDYVRRILAMLGLP